MKSFPFRPRENLSSVKQSDTTEKRWAPSNVSALHRQRSWDRSKIPKRPLSTRGPRVIVEGVSSPTLLVWHTPSFSRALFEKDCRVLSSDAGH